MNQFYEGLAGIASNYDVRLIGGDTSRTTEQIVIIRSCWANAIRARP